MTQIFHSTEDFTKHCWGELNWNPDLLSPVISGFAAEENYSDNPCGKLNKLPGILQLVFWIFSYLVKYEWSENAKALQNIPIQTIIVFSKWLPTDVVCMTLLITENTSLCFSLNSDLNIDLFSDSEIQLQSPSPFSDPCFRGYCFE